MSIGTTDGRVMSRLRSQVMELIRETSISSATAISMQWEAESNAVFVARFYDIEKPSVAANPQVVYFANNSGFITANEYRYVQIGNSSATIPAVNADGAAGGISLYQIAAGALVTATGRKAELILEFWQCTATNSPTAFFSWGFLNSASTPSFHTGWAQLATGPIVGVMFDVAGNLISAKAQLWRVRSLA